MVTLFGYKDPLKNIGLILIFLGLLAIIYALPLVQYSIYPYEDAVTELAKNVPPINATRIIIGVILCIMGLLLFFSKKILNILVKKTRDKR